MSATPLECPRRRWSNCIHWKEAEEETRGKEWKVKVIERAGIKLAHQVPVGIQLLCSQHQQVELIMCIEVFLLSDLRVESENV